MDDQQIAQTEHEAIVAKLEQQVQEHLEGWKRAKADYLNLKKQMEKEKDDIIKFSQAAVVMEILPIYDNLKRAESHIPEEQKTQEWVKGIIHIQKQFEDTLKTMGIEPIQTVGEAFDAHKHHAVSKVKQEGVASDTVVEEVKSGFMLGDKVLTPAQVVVAE
ncbi:MAG: nucleotide exchange factor GrpE [Candidatus Kerfeldbacteria bacterium]|nr:nucleotide exchange factor GrpE [Candidatus Kerfeldbacteria bacterium]